MFFWTKQKIEWYCRAAEASCYHRSLAESIYPELLEGTVCDLGCGLGFLSLALAEKLPCLDALDCDESALEILRRNIRDRGVCNISVLCADAFSVSCQWDQIVLCFFGGLERNFSHYRKIARKRIVAVMSSAQYSGLRPGELFPKGRERSTRTREFLTEQRIPFREKSLILEFGQPLRDRREAEEFLLSYSPQAGKDEIRRHLDQNLCTEPRKIGGEIFPLYLPNRKELSVFTVFLKE